MASAGFLIPTRATSACGTTAAPSAFARRFSASPTIKLTVIVLANRADLDPEDLALKVADLYLEKKR